ncbi:cohesin domain-containing protein [Desulfatibacillum aliphaticivorans]|uniref:Cohesin domain-containing protein n=1 Tax=Desulfatibacillum aliphaticivorans TaxID=218208 RepID=B8FJ12_DESAL|nr:cohesin domain-containing protein [Desulfatibacillum aliphaticivorans]ACL04939.1 hypothetical protein Dalk_3249 [Desulfatibacillum aliphaticivorans]
MQRLAKHFLVLAIIILIAGWQDLYADFQKPEKSGSKDMMSILLKAENAPSGVRAMGLEIHYNPQVLEFEKCERTGLMKKGFSMFGSNIVKPGVLRMGGIDPSADSLPSGVSGDLFILRFKMVGKGSPDFAFKNFKDDIQEWSTRIGPCNADDSPVSGLVLCIDE